MSFAHAVDTAATILWQRQDTSAVAPSSRTFLLCAGLSYLRAVMERVWTGVRSPETGSHTKQTSPDWLRVSWSASTSTRPTARSAPVLATTGRPDRIPSPARRATISEIHRETHLSGSRRRSPTFPFEPLTRADPAGAPNRDTRNNLLTSSLSTSSALNRHTTAGTNARKTAGAEPMRLCAAQLKRRNPGPRLPTLS